MDSYQFLKSSLEGLVKMLPNEKLRHTKRHFAHPDLIARKGVYPYEYMYDASRFLETELPGIEKFYSSLTSEGIPREDYEHAKNVWNAYDVKSLREYHDLYLKSDVTLLSDVFVAFREMSLDTYKLDPVHFYTAPGLSWEACFLYTDV